MVFRKDKRISLVDLFRLVQSTVQSDLLLKIGAESFRKVAVGGHVVAGRENGCTDAFAVGLTDLPLGCASVFMNSCLG